ncbi:glycosyltransferase family 2 protein [Ferrigenium sp. UT5]|uniref:glycosyltransferase family 2 protein n=1 Tax=Ferrigenium sp. UT5 TaxID=3242105 RepID=UPI0038B26157
MSTPMVSVIVPSYNHGKYIQECIQSIIDQDYQNIELIIIDDGSNDDSVEKIRELATACTQRFVRFEFRTRPNKGLCATLNEGLAWCKGVYFSPSASDDVLLKNKITAQVDGLERNAKFGVVAVFSGISVFNEDSKKIKEKSSRECIFGFEEAFLRSRRMTGQSVMMVRASVLAVGGYDPRFKIEDLYLFLKLTEKGGKLLTIKGIGVKYRKHNDNFSSKHSEMWLSVRGILDQYKYHPLYHKAVSSSMMIQARGLLRSDSKLLSLLWAFNAIKEYPGILFSRSMIKFFVKIFMPKALR